MYYIIICVCMICLVNVLIILYHMYCRFAVAIASKLFAIANNFWGMVLWVRYGRYGGYGGYVRVGTVRCSTVRWVRGTVRWVRYGGYGGYGRCVPLPTVLYPSTYRTVYCTHRTVPTVHTVPYHRMPTVPHP